jgi:histone acetyltransferase HTATIP
VIIKKPKAEISTESINGVEVIKTHSTSEAGMKGQYSISLTLGDLAKACHLRLDDVSETLARLGFLRYRRRAIGKEGQVGEVAEQWADTEVIILREDVEREWTKWKVKPRGVLDQACVLL